MINNFLYIDPGTGSMLFSLFIGIATAGIFGLRALFLKLKFILSGGKLSKEESANSIPFVIFSDHKRYWNIFKPICDEFEKRNIPLTYYSASSDDPAFAENYKIVKTEFIGEGNRAFARLNMLHADIVLSTTPGLDVYQWKRSKAVKCYVHIPHYVGDLSDYRMFGLDYYDAVLISGKNQEDFVRKIESLRPAIKQKEIFSVGSLVLDNLKAKLDACGKIEQNEIKTVLVAPSWGKSGILSRYGEKILTALQKTGYKIIVRPHPQSVSSEKNILNPLMGKFSSIEWNFDNDNFAVLNKADVLISDFSGVIFDYSLVFGKPVIYADTKFDTAPYDADWVDEKIWSLRAVEKLGVQLREEDFDNIKDVIDKAISSEKLKEARNEVIAECWDKQDSSAANTVEWLLAKQKELTKYD